MNNDLKHLFNHFISLSVIRIRCYLVCKARKANVINKKVMYRLLLCILVLFSNILILNAQTLKTYSGKYMSGTATYTYKDNPEGGRIYEGDFIYVGNNGIDKVRGKFKNDKKEGQWTYTYRDFMNPMSVLKVAYKNGMLDGLYQYTSNSSYISLTIRNGKFVGNINGKNIGFSYKRGWSGSNYITTLKSFKGQFDENGYCDGKWVLQQDDVIYFYGFYEHGVCKRFYREDLTTGDIENVTGQISYMINIIIENNYKSIECMIERNNIEWKWRSVEKETQVVAEETQEVFEIVDEMPEFSGGIGAMTKYIDEHLNYPTVAREKGIQGRVLVTCVINEDGSVSDAEVKQGLDCDLDKEAIRIVQSMPKWKPGRMGGKNVRVRYIIPVVFRL